MEEKWLPWMARASDLNLTENIFEMFSTATLLRNSQEKRSELKDNLITLS